ncbi:MAG: response regulator, partial [Candidatus Electrothrix sp. ATG1]|nr:response regulator [Candidatus Electrothrix sp. ATG1]
MSKENILVVEDDMDIQQLVSYHLIRAGYNVSCADSGEQGLQLLIEEKFSAVILDLMLPGKNGIEVCAEIRKDPQNQHLPIIMLTALGEEDDIVAGLSGGADDYVTKPFSPKVLMARVEAVLRRDIDKRKADSEDEEVITIHNLCITPRRHQVLVGEKPVQLTTTTKH